jgi:hypothetical protein
MACYVRSKMQIQHERDTEMKLKLGINFASGTRISGYSTVAK